MSIVIIIVRKIIKKLITEMDLLHQTDANKITKKVCLLQKIHFNY